MNKNSTKEIKPLDGAKMSYVGDNNFFVGDTMFYVGVLSPR